MSIYTQAFLINTILLFSFAFFDRNFFNDSIENLFPVAFVLWALFTLISLPVWLIYLVLS